MYYSPASICKSVDNFIPSGHLKFILNLVSIDTTKSTAKKEKRSTEKTESSKSEKKGTKRQFLAHPSYERSTGESYPYHGGMFQSITFTGRLVHETF